MRRAALASFFLVLASAASAHAEPSAAAVEEGRTRFSKGVVLFRAGDYKAALAEFTRANAVAPSFRIQFNIGQTCAELQDHVCAAKAFEAFLNEGGKQVPPAQRTTAERELKRLHGLVGRIRVLVNQDEASLTVDDAPVGTSPLADPVLVSAGKHKVTARKGGSATTTVEVPAGETVEAQLSVADVTGSVAPVTTSGRPSRAPFWIGVAATGVLAVTTVALGVATLGADGSLGDEVGRFGVSPGAIEDARSSVDTLAIVTDVVLVATLAAAAVTTYFFFKTQPPRSGSAARAAFTF